MKVLLDSHSFLWLAESPDQLSPEAASICQALENTLFLSVASLWELQIKSQLGKLRLNLPLKTLLDEQQRVNRVVLLPIAPDHVFALDKLESHHRDPFDRLLIAQSVAETLPILSRDPVFAKYPVKVMW